ncbi:E3 ubiquitin-protein ligase IPI1-like [Salvia hispanica]|uniref:E3 ubiquitin-protein ligase IPI1-like n=1 Tax=Salvia hispanica TaxID=49212 RepID=UPI0020092698|nr:E3 ubiquitin-protein ligase IPI1-like [Salvia hispanica]
MGLGEEADLLDDGDSGVYKAAAVSCSICLEAVTDNGDRSWAKLQCGHQFHLDCIGSAFNIKGSMQCPNCRKIEKGQWLYANGSRPLPEFSMDDWAHDEDLYDNYSEMSFGVHWCPFNGLTRLQSSFDEGEFSSSTYHDLVGHHAVFAEHTPVSSTTHPCPYIAYFGPVHPSSTASSTSVSDGSNYSNHWTGPTVPSEVPNSYAFPSMDMHYQNWDHSSQFAPNNRIVGADQPLITPMTQRTTRNSSDIPWAGMHPSFMLGHSSASRAPSSGTSVPTPYPGTVARTRDRPSRQAYFQQSSSNPSARNPVLPTGRRSSSHRSSAHAAPVASASDQSGGFYFFSGSSGRNVHEMENSHHDHFHGWEREQPSFPSSQVDRDSIWGPFQPPAPAAETRTRPNGFRQRHGSDRLPSHNRS